MTEELTLNLTPKKFRCSNGHEWTDEPGTTSLGAGWSLDFYNPLVDKIHEMSLKLGPYCNICLHKKLEVLLAGVGTVTEIKAEEQGFGEMRIKEAAIVFKGGIWTGPSHHEIIKSIVLDTKGEHVRGEMQGFVADNGGFYDRYDAGKIALAAGQVKKLRGQMLYSEDLLDAQN